MTTDSLSIAWMDGQLISFQVRVEGWIHQQLAGSIPAIPSGRELCLHRPTEQAIPPLMELRLEKER